MLYMATITFTTGENQYSEQRIVSVNQNDRRNPDNLGSGVALVKDADEFDLEIAFSKVRNWFPTQFPESEWISTRIHPTI